ncbi:MAG: hypothetical protein IJB41_07605 [Clostridia bacterium]|nr:hypothetical protein [Clostridia bacterium]
MEMNVLNPSQNQLQLALAFAAAGGLCALCAALLAAFFGPGRLRAAGSFLSGCLCALIACAACVLFANGKLRFFMLPAIAVGAAAAHFLFVAPISRLLRLIRRAIARLCGRISRCALLQRLAK